jgi:type I restriction enzyme S subunit
MTKLIPLGEICKFVYGESLKEEKRQPGKIPVFGSNGIVGWHNQPLTHGPTIVIGRKGSIGEINWSEGPCFPIDTTYYVEKTKRPCELRWLYYALLQFDLTRLNKSSAVPGLNREDAYEQRIAYSELSEQRWTADLLDKADRLCRTRRYILELSTSFEKSAWVELFGSPFKAFKRFPTYELGEVTKFIDYRGISPNKVSAGVRLVTARNVKRGYFEVEPQEFIPANEYESWMMRGMPKPGDVLFTTEGHTLGSAAKLPPFERVALAQRLIAFQPLDNLKSDYLLQFILSRYFQYEVAKHSTGSAARGISSKNLAEIKIPVPPLELQERFASLVSYHERLWTRHRELLRQVDHLFQTLLHQLFTET